MAVVRLFDLFNCKLGSTQVVGAESFAATYGKRTVTASNDGGAGLSARDKTAFYASATLGCQGISQLATLLDLFRSNDSLSVLAEGKKDKTLVSSSSGKFTAARMKLVGCNMSFRQGQYAQTTFNFRNSAAAASDSADDEITYTEAAGTITHSTTKRGVRITSAAFSTGSLTPLGVEGLDLNIQGQADQAYGDSEYGETVEVLGYDVTGTLYFKDLSLSTGATIAQRLLDAASGTLTIGYNEAVTGTKTLTLANVIFNEDAVNLAARRFHTNAMQFGCFFNNGTTEFTLAQAATNPIIAIA